MSEVGFGGAFLRVRDPEALYAWYEQHLGLRRSNGVFEFPEADRRAPVVLAFFGADEDHFPRTQPAMLNLQVDDLDGLLDRLAAAGVPIEAERPSYDFGRFGWITDPEGNRIELWQPAPER